MSDDGVTRQNNTNTTTGGRKASDGAEPPKSFQGDLTHLPDALAPLITIPHWVLWRWQKTPKGKWTKVPYQPNGENAKNNNPQTWSSYETVIAAMKTFDGIGFCLLGRNFAAFDIDNCRNPDTGAIDPWAT